MRSLRLVVRIALNSGGWIIGAAWQVGKFVQQRQPMSWLEWVGAGIVLLSMLYGVIELVVWLIRLRADVTRQANASAQMGKDVSALDTLLNGAYEKRIASLAAQIDAHNKAHRDAAP